MCGDGGADSTQVGVVVDLFLDAHEHGRVPLVESRYAIVVLYRLGESVDVLVFQVLDQFLDKLALPSVSEGGVEPAVLLYGVRRVEDINAQVAQRRAEHVLLGAVLQQAVVQGRLGDLLVYLHGLVVVLELRRVLRQLEHALVGGGGGLLAAEVVSRLLVVLHGARQVHALGLVQLGYVLMLLSCNSETAHVSVDLNCF